MASDLNRYHKDDDMVYFKPQEFFLDRVWHGFYNCARNTMLNNFVINPVINKCFMAGTIVGAVGSVLYAGHALFSHDLDKLLISTRIFLFTSLLHLIEPHRPEMPEFALHVLTSTLYGAMYLFLAEHNNWPYIIPSTCGIAALPTFLLGIRACAHALNPETIKLSFGNLNNSWPAQLYRAGWLKRYYNPHYGDPKDFVDE